MDDQGVAQRIKAFITNNKPATIVGAIALLLLIGGAAYALTRPEAATEPVAEKKETSAPVEKKEIGDFDIHAIGDMGELTVVSPANLVVLDKTGKDIENITVDPGGTIALVGKNFSANEYSIYQIENPALSDGSIFVLPQAKQFSPAKIATDSNEATMTVEVDLVKVEVADMTQQQLYHAAEKIRAGGNEELANTLLARIDSASIGESDDGSAKPEGWEDSALNPRKGMQWRATIVEQVKTVTSQAWDETVTSGGEMVYSSFLCTCGAGPFGSDGEWMAHSQANTIIEEHIDASGNVYFIANGNGHGIVPQGQMVGQTTEVIHHPEESVMETKVTSPAGWFPR